MLLSITTTHRPATDSWLVEERLFVGSLDLRNLEVVHVPQPARRHASDLRRPGLEYDRSRRIVACRRRAKLRLPYRYLGADDQAGPNYTGQPTVDSYYEVVEGARR
jgi:hypothetical protein